MTTPAITLTATLESVTGGLVGSAANPSQMRITLCGFGYLLPTVPGVCNLDKVGPLYLDSTNGSISTLLWGIALLDDQRNIVQAGLYQLTGSGTVDLSSLTPIIQPGQSITGITGFFSGAPTAQLAAGTVDGANAAFTFTAPPSPTPLVAVYAGGIYQSAQNGDYSIAYTGTNTWTVTFAVAPVNAPVAVLLFQQLGSGSRTITAPSAIVVSGVTADNTLFCNFSAAGAITLPSAASAGISYELSFIDISYSAATNNITLSGSVNNGGSYVIGTNGGAVTLRSDGSVWRVKSTN